MESRAEKRNGNVEIVVELTPTHRVSHSSLEFSVGITGDGENLITYKWINKFSNNIIAVIEELECIFILIFYQSFIKSIKWNSWGFLRLLGYLIFHPKNSWNFVYALDIESHGNLHKTLWDETHAILKINWVWRPFSSRRHNIVCYLFKKVESYGSNASLE